FSTRYISSPITHVLFPSLSSQSLCTLGNFLSFPTRRSSDLQFDDRLEVDVVLAGELGGQFLVRLGDGLVDPGQVSGVVTAPLVALDADGDRTECDRGLRGALTECDHSFGLFGDLGGAQCAVDLDREGPVPGVSSFGVVVTGSGATGGDAEG